MIDARFQLLSRLGQGAMGTVFLASRGEEQVALKMLDIERDDPLAMGRFVREARVASNLKHPGIVPVIESGFDEASGRCFIVMPLVRGKDLQRVLKRTGALPPELAIHLALQAADALAFAHEAGVIHRDIKPSNLLIVAEGETVRVQVTDFGLAKETQATTSLTATGAMMGSPRYMAPEQFLDTKRADRRADVWGLAMTFYEMLAGQPALGHLSSFPELALAVNTGEIPPLQGVAPWVHPELATILHAALLSDLGARCPDLGAFARALRHFAGPGADQGAQTLRGLSAEERAVTARSIALPTSWTIDVGPLLAVSAVDADALIGETLGGIYHLERKLGQGGMGAVYEAITPDGQRAAVKVISRSTQNRDVIRRFMREARATSAIESRHVVGVLDAADDDGGKSVPFLAMELLDGLDLDTLIKRAGALEPRAAARVFVQAARGLSAAHEKSIVHRDIKPANLFLHEEAEGIIVTKICDFGVAKNNDVSEDHASTMDLTRTGGMLGSPVYMSPEQASNAKGVDARTDLWSLCLSLYEALSGQRPWADCTMMGQLILAICTRDITPIQDLAPWVSPELAAIVHKGLERDVARRWSSSAELAAALEPLALPGEVTRRDLCALTAAQRARFAPRFAPRFAGSTSATTPAPGADLTSTEDIPALTTTQGPPSPPPARPRPRPPRLCHPRPPRRLRPPRRSPPIPRSPPPRGRSPRRALRREPPLPRRRRSTRGACCWRAPSWWPRRSRVVSG
jgi:serine/threonine protein kinase